MKSFKLGNVFSGGFVCGGGGGHLRLEHFWPGILFGKGFFSLAAVVSCRRLSETPPRLNMGGRFCDESV